MKWLSLLLVVGLVSGCSKHEVSGCFCVGKSGGFGYETNCNCEELDSDFKEATPEESAAILKTLGAEVKESK